RLGGCRGGVSPARVVLPREGETPSRQPAGRRRYVRCSAAVSAAVVAASRRHALFFLARARRPRDSRRDAGVTFVVAPPSRRLSWRRLAGTHYSSSRGRDALETAGGTPAL